MTMIDTPKKKVLIIDDNSGILFALREALELDGYTVFSTAVFESAEHVSQSAPDLIFLDIFLSNQDGRQITRDLKTHQGTKHIPIIILSAYPGIDALAKEAGADDYLAKPFDLADLFAMTKKYTARTI
jgi:CheY-like chemotaxis protein